MSLYTYNSKGQEISKIEYNEGKWAYKNLTSFDGNIKTTLVIYNEEGKEIKEQEIKEKFHPIKRTLLQIDQNITLNPF